MYHFHHGGVLYCVFSRNKTTDLPCMEKRNLKTLINDLERAIAEIKSEVYSDTNAYRIDSGDGIKSYAQINDEDGECD